MVTEDRPRIFKYITERFGKDKTARVASYGTIQARGVVDEVCRAKMFQWNLAHGKKKDDKSPDNPYGYDFSDKIKKEFPKDIDALLSDAIKHGQPLTSVPIYGAISSKYPEVFRYFEGLYGAKISQSVHPAGMVISPIDMESEYGVFEKDGDLCLLLDMDEAHEVGAAKYDFLGLKTVKVIRDCCNYIGIGYPKTNEINWNDEEVWADMRLDQTAIFQFESEFAANSFRRFKTDSIYDMSLVTACIRPSGASYRDALLARVPHKNPSPVIDELLKDNLGYLIYQCDTLRFLQEICGLSGSEADNVRRAIGRKQKDRLEKALPSILEGYCAKSEKPRAEAEQEAKEFLQVIEDSASYQFGYNHSIAYCLLGYLCGYFRYHYPMEFATAYLNNAMNDEDIENGQKLLTEYKIKISNPKWGVSKGGYFFDRETKTIYKGLGSVKYMGGDVADELFELSKRSFTHFVDLLHAVSNETSLDSRQLDILIKIDFFDCFGNQRELHRIVEFFEMFNKGEAKQIKKAKVDGTPLESIVKKHAVGTTKSGGEAKSYTLLDVMSILRDTEDYVKSLNLDDVTLIIRANNFMDCMGYAGYTTGKPEDRRKLFISDVIPVKRRSDNHLFAYNIITSSIGRGVNSKISIKEREFRRNPLKKGDLIFCKSNPTRNNRGYFEMAAKDYEKIVS